MSSPSIAELRDRLATAITENIGHAPWVAALTSNVGTDDAFVAADELANLHAAHDAGAAALLVTGTDGRRFVVAIVEVSKPGT